MLKNKIFALTFRIFGFFFALSGVFSSIGVFGGELSFKMLMYYTIQSNIFVVVLFGILVVKTAIGLKNDGKHGNVDYTPRLAFVCMVDIFITFLVFWTLLAPQLSKLSEGYSMWSFTNLATHGITPILLIIDYYMFTPFGRLKYRDTYYIAIFPVLYLVMSTIAGFSGYTYALSENGSVTRFPYFFIDYDQNGWFVLLYVFVIMIVILSISHLLYLLDKKSAKKSLGCSNKNS